ncbi:16S rRNA (cytosine(1402)-N(4))-methyltransferase RsmH [Bengtsoniella intestinalis]|uniref:16S rRNA (cytosine(1402)-N(4))-methyltransferase RsmH n=1 Tax=Bengtsoniella intestinalis TaxID=3073143 RepID=UPI00391F75D4
MDEQTPHKRRVRYSGTHPKRFQEKYKELNPEKYGDDVQRIIAKGNTPAGMHISIMVEEILGVLNIQSGEKGLDATLGYGGHTTAMLEKLQGKGHVYGLDIDPIEIVKTTERLRGKGFGEELFTPVHTNFANLATVAQDHGTMDFLLADLGVSSMQIDNPERGFSFKREGKLDLRLNPEQGISAAERLASVSMEELEGMFVENADEPLAYPIAKAVVKSRDRHPVQTTTDLKKIVESVVAKDKSINASQRELVVKKTCQRVFQALRIDVNQEYEVLHSFLEALPEAMSSGGRIAILTFHSGEDRLVKKAFKAGLQAGVYKEIAQDVVRPTAAECGRNPRATSTKLRWAIKE